MKSTFIKKLAHLYISCLMHFSHLFYIFNISFNFCLALLLQASLIYSPLQIILLKDRRSAVVRDILNEKCSKCNSKCSCWYFLTFFWLLFPFIQRVRTCHIDSFVPLSHNVKAGLLAIYVIGILWS